MTASITYSLCCYVLCYVVLLCSLLIFVFPLLVFFFLPFFCSNSCYFFCILVLVPSLVSCKRFCFHPYFLVCLLCITLSSCFSLFSSNIYREMGCRTLFYPLCSSCVAYIRCLPIYVVVYCNVFMFCFVSVIIA